MSSIACQLSFVRSTLPEGVKLVAVSKTHPAEAIRAAYDAGHRVFGESRPQELREKHEALPKDIEWHMIGHLQTNKIKYIAPFVDADPFGRQRAAGRGDPARGGQVRPDARNPPGDPRRRGGDQNGLEYGRTDGVCPHGPVCAVCRTSACGA